MIPTAEEVRRMSIDARGTHASARAHTAAGAARARCASGPRSGTLRIEKAGSDGRGMAGARGDHRPDRRAHPCRCPHYSWHAPRASDVRPCSDLCRERFCNRWW